MSLLLFLYFTTGLFVMVEGEVTIALTINSYTNIAGTAYVEKSSNRTCCDGPQRSTCNVGDTCDTYFDVCVGRMQQQWGCQGAFFHTTPLNNTNNITAGEIGQLTMDSSLWGPGMLIFVFIYDEDGNTTAEKHDHIDTLIDELKVDPSRVQANTMPHIFDWNGKTSLNLTLEIWCADNYYGANCSAYCQGISPMAVCDSDTGQLTCQYSDELLIAFDIQADPFQFNELDVAIHSFFDDHVCDSHDSHLYYPKLDYNSNTLSFSGYCNDVEVTALEFESLLLLTPDTVLNKYFSLGVVRGKAVTPQGYGEHIVPNVYIGLEIIDAENPSGKSYDGNNTSGERRCCDKPDTINCNIVEDKCDMQFSICIGEMLNGVCIGAVTLTKAYMDTVSLSTCGPTLLDYTTGQAYVAHSMIGGLRLTKNSVSISVTVRDSDLDGQSFDIIDVLHNSSISIQPGDNITDASLLDIVMKNTTTVKIRLRSWCAPGHSGPLCHADNGTDQCATGWRGDDCETPLHNCGANNPCQHGGKCNTVGPDMVSCHCPPGYTGISCETDVNECLLHICQNGGTCQNLDGAFNCICPYNWTGLICTEQALACFHSPCLHGSCHELSLTSTLSGYSCQCDSGWHGDNCDQKTMCSQYSCNHGNCSTGIGSKGSLFCICDGGFTGDNCTEDINECQAKPCKNGGSCVNTFGSFSCNCALGFSGQFCQNASCVNTVCQNNGTCTVWGNNYIEECVCPHGFNGHLCENSIHVCEDISCLNGGTCIDGFARFCQCLPGFDGYLCQYVTCSKTACQNNGTCVTLLQNNEFGHCDCQSGFTGTICETNIDYCKGIVCSNGGSCYETNQDFKCNCSKGWSGKTCDADINECSHKVCKNFAICENLPGTYNCACTAGWSGQNCEHDFDECSVMTQCANDGNCTNTIGSYVCNCATGYEGPHCTQQLRNCLNETCEGNGVCQERTQGYHCQCDPGYKGDRCEIDIDECTQNICGAHGINCTNNYGSFNCTCLKGWTGKSCSQDVDECSTSSFLCSGNGRCKNTNDGFTCDCLYGFTGKTCDTFLNGCNNLKCFHNSTCKLSLDGPICSCAQGFTGITCTSDINECESLPCSNSGTCFNTEGSFYCNCLAGWEGNTCGKDINECLEPNACLNNGVCSNTAGSYKCACQTDFLGLSCEIGTMHTSVGSTLQMNFQRNISSNSKQVTLSRVYDFVKGYVCNNTLPKILLESILGNKLIFSASCANNIAITDASLNKALVQHGPTNFPNPVTSVTQTLKSQDKPTKPSTTWVGSHWYVLVVSIGGVLVVAVVAGIFIYKRRNSKWYGNSNFNNPAFDAN